MNIENILKEHNLRRTSCREGIIAVINQSPEALSENQIKSKLESNYDRTTFYRSFKTLEDSGILHKIVVDGQQIKYGLTPSVSNRKPHAHFYCYQCKSVICLDSSFELPSLPSGFRNSEADLLIKGYCKHCNKSL